MGGFPRAQAARRLRIAAVVAAWLASAGTALAAFPQSAPNDPGYAPAEQGGLGTCLTTSVNSEQHYLYGFMPMCPKRASDPEAASGMSVDRAWRDYTTGAGATIAYIEGGINWHAGDVRELANRVFLNAGELPPPTTPQQGQGVCNPHQLCAADYSDTPDANGNGVVDPEDIIVRFSNGADDDGNGYVDDISGWDFYDDQNDPATVDSTYGHANGQMEQAAAEADNGIGGAGVCPRCMVMPIKAGAEALDRTDDLAQAWLYAADMNMDVLVSTTADLGYSPLMRQVVEHVWRSGTVMVESSNDFDSTDHQGGMWWPHVLPGNGMVTNTQGLDTVPGSAAAVNALTTSYRERSGYTSWGTHNVFTVATQGGTTSESTPTVGGVIALVRAYGKKAARQGLISRPLSADEAVQVVRATASDVDDPSLDWPNGRGWDLQYGYGRPNVYRAMKAIHDGDIPPTGWIDSPGWYRLYDPTQRARVPVTGHVAAPRSSGYTWKVEFAPGAQPAEGQFIPAGHGSGHAPFTGRLGEIDLSKVPRSFWSAAFRVSRTKTLESSEQYTVTIRLVVRDAEGRVAEDRRAIDVVHDPSWLPGFPKYLGTGGESQAALADLQGTGRLAIVFGTAAGTVHAIDPKSGRDLPGFPVHTRRNALTVPHPGIRPGYEPILANVAVGDLRGRGEEDVVATTTTGRVYAWGPRGRLLPGWPQKLDRGVTKPPIPRPAEPFTRLPVVGASAPPVLYDLNGDGKLEIVQAAWDGHLYAFEPDGSQLRGWPVDVKLPPGYTPRPGYTTIHDYKLDTPPAIGDLDGDGRPELVVRTQMNDVLGAGLQPAEVSHLLAYHADGSPVAGFPTSNQAIIGYYGSAQEFITEGVSIPALADVDGDGADEIAFAPGIFSPTYLLGGDGQVRAVYGPVPDATAQLLSGQAGLDTLLGVLDGNLPADAPVNFTTFGTFGRFGPGGRLVYAAPASGGASVAASLLLPGSGFAIQNYVTAYDAATGAPLPGFPSKLQGLDFLGGPDIADVSGDGQADIVNAADSSALQAFTTTGAEVSGFPKFTTGWVVYAPAVGDLDSDGHNDVVALTREGYLFAWRTPGKAGAADESWRSSHDEWNTDAYGNDTRPPGVARELRARGGTLRFVAPGDDWYAGRPDHYELTLCEQHGDAGSCTERRLPAAAAAGGTEKLAIPRGTDYLYVQAVDDAGNLGGPSFLDLRR